MTMHDDTPRDLNAETIDSLSKLNGGLTAALGAHAKRLQAISRVLALPGLSAQERVILIHLVAETGALDFDREVSVYGLIAHYGFAGRTVRGFLHSATEQGLLVTTVRTGRPSLYRVVGSKLLAESQAP